MKKIILIVFLGVVIMRFAPQAQQTTPEFKYGNTFFSDYIADNANLDEQQICDRELHLIRFRIDTSGNVIDISFSRNTDLPIRNALRAVLKSTSGRWKSSTIGNKPVISKALILPCLIGIENGCSQQVIDAYFQPNDSLLKSSYHLDSLQHFVSTQGKRTLSQYYAAKSFRAMNDLFYFDDGEISLPVDCILLSQIHFVYYH